MPSVSVEHVEYRGFVHFDDTCINETRAREAYALFRHSNIRATQKLHPLFARGEPKPLFLKVCGERLEATVSAQHSRRGSNSNSPSPIGSPISRPTSPLTNGSGASATVVDARIAKIFAVVVCKKKLLVFLSPGAHQTRSHCHCFCLPTKEDLESVVQLLALQTNVVRLSEKEHRRTRSMPSLALASLRRGSASNPGSNRGSMLALNQEDGDSGVEAAGVPVKAGKAISVVNPSSTRSSTTSTTTGASTTMGSTGWPPQRRGEDGDFLSSSGAGKTSGAAGPGGARSKKSAFHASLFRFGTMVDLSQLSDDDACSSATDSAAPSACASASGSTLHLDVDTLGANSGDHTLHSSNPFANFTDHHHHHHHHHHQRESSSLAAGAATASSSPAAHRFEKGRLGMFGGVRSGGASRFDTLVGSGDQGCEVSVPLHEAEQDRMGDAGPAAEDSGSVSSDTLLPLLPHPPLAVISASSSYAPSPAPSSSSTLFNTAASTCSTTIYGSSMCEVCRETAVADGVLTVCGCSKEAVFVGSEEIAIIPSSVASPISSPRPIKRTFRNTDAIYTPALPILTSSSSMDSTTGAASTSTSSSDLPPFGFEDLGPEGVVPLPTTNIATLDTISVDVLWNALNRVLDANTRINTQLCVSSAGVIVVKDEGNDTLYARPSGDVVDACTIDGFLCLVCCVPGCARRLLQFFQLADQGRDLAASIRARRST